MEGSPVKGCFNFSNLKLRYRPYPIGVAKNLIESSVYKDMVRDWPQTDLFLYMPRLGNKYALSEKFHAKQYHAFIKNSPVWKTFYKWIKSEDFIYSVMDVLFEHGIDLGYRRPANKWKYFYKNLKSIIKRQPPKRGARLNARFEFQMMPETGGHIFPHTDTASKFVTIVVSMTEAWDKTVGGGTDVNQPKDITKDFNWLNRQASFEEMDVVDTFEFEPNQGVIFVKTFNSWHSVRPMVGANPDNMRRSLIINLTRAD